jgi:hypothetical protein
MNNVFEKFKDFALTTEQARTINGGHDCGEGETAYWCTISWDGGPTTGGVGCGTSAGQAGMRLQQAYTQIENGFGGGTAVGGCNPIV